MKQQAKKQQANQTQQGSSPGSENAVELLKSDHAKVKDLFKQFEGTASDKEGLATQIFNELDVHAMLEEEIFYPAVRDQIGSEQVADLEGEETDEGETDEEVDDLEDEESAEELIEISYEEHKLVKELISELRKMDPKSDQFKERFAELKEDVLNHVSEEEEVIFPAAQLKLNLQELGAQIQKKKIERMSAMADR